MLCLRTLLSDSYLTGTSQRDGDSGGGRDGVSGGGTETVKEGRRERGLHREGRGRY